MRSILLLSLIVLLCGCAGPRRMSAAKFQKNYASIQVVSTISATEYLGQREGKAYLRIGSMNLFTQKWSKQDYYVDLDDLDPEFRKTLPIEGFSLDEYLLEEQSRRAASPPAPEPGA